MARQLRIEFPGAFYHVTSRGNQKQALFLSDEDRFFFLKCLGNAHERYRSIFHVYCLMENHYHLFLETPDAGLSKIMHLINTSYAIYFNKKHERCGHPFQGRFKSILVQAEEYARELAPYIHLNPVRACLVDRPEDYSWSNYREYLGLMTTKPWTSNSFILNLFAADTGEARRKYEEYVIWRLSKHSPSPLEEAKATGILGKPEFTEQIKKLFIDNINTAPNRELPQRRKLMPQLAFADIQAAAILFFGPRNRYSKKIAIYISHKKTSYTLDEISDFFQIGISGITDICRRITKELTHNGGLADAIKEIERRLCCFAAKNKKE